MDSDEYDDYDEYKDPESDSDFDYKEESYVSENDKVNSALEINEKTIAEQTNEKIMALTLKLENGQLDIGNFNTTLLMIYQDRINDGIRKYNATYNKLKYEELNEELKELLTKLFNVSSRTNKKLDPTHVEESIDDIFQKYGRMVELGMKTFTENFESNPIKSDIYNALYAPVELPSHKAIIAQYQHGVATNELSIDDVMEYITTRTDVITNCLTTRYPNDVMYEQFNSDLMFGFTAIRTQLESNIEEIFENIANGVATVDRKISDLLETLATKYKNESKKVFQDYESYEVLKLIDQLDNSYISDGVKYEKRFTHEEIREDFKNEPLHFIIAKYGKYLSSNYFSWTAKALDEDDKLVIKFDRKLAAMPNREMNIMRELQLKEYDFKKRIVDIMSKLDKNLLLSCAYDLQLKGIIKEPAMQYNKQEQYINDLYSSATSLMSVSRYASETMKEYASTVNKVVDEFAAGQHLMEHQLGYQISVGDNVVIDRNTLTDKAENQTGRNIKGVPNKKMGLYNISFGNFTGKVTAVKGDMVSVKLTGTDYVKDFPRYAVKSKNADKPSKLYIVMDDNTFNPAAPLKNTSILHITKWIKALLGVKDFAELSREQLSELYDKAEEVYKSLSKADKAKIDKKVITQYVNSSFVDGVPDKGPLIYVYPPKLPEFSDRGDSNDSLMAEFDEYAKQLREYIKNLTPEINPYIQMGTTVSNQLISHINDKSYANIEQAVKNTPVGGFFKLRSVMGLEKVMVSMMTRAEKYKLQRNLLSSYDLMEFEMGFYADSGKDTVKAEKPMDPRIGLLRNLRTATTVEEYIEGMKKVDRNLKIDKIVGENVYANGREEPVSKRLLEDNYYREFEKEYTNRAEIIVPKQDVLTESIIWGLTSVNPSFQLLDLSSNFEDTFILHLEPVKYRIRFTNKRGNFYSGWEINPVEEYTDVKTETGKVVKHTYKYKYPIIITDFTEYVKILRANFLTKYEYFGKLDILNYNEFNESIYLMTRIQYINKYLEDMGIDSSFSIKLIEQKDENLYLRKEQIDNLTQALIYMGGNSMDPDKIKGVACDIEQVVYDLFTDIRSGTVKTKTYNEQSFDDLPFENLLDFLRSDVGKKSELGKYILTSMLRGHRKKHYVSYITRMGIVVYNIYHTNGFIDDYLTNGGENSGMIDKIVFRNLSSKEIMEPVDTLENILLWKPDSIINDRLKNENAEVYYRTIGDKNIPTMKLFDDYSHEARNLLYIEKKLALIELIRGKMWTDTLETSKRYSDSKRTEQLIRCKNMLRSEKNITYGKRLSTMQTFNNAIRNCGLAGGLVGGGDEDLIIDKSEKLEMVCYNLSVGAEEYNDIVFKLIKDDYNFCKVLNKVGKDSNITDIVLMLSETYIYLGLEKPGNSLSYINKSIVDIVKDFKGKKIEKERKDRENNQGVYDVDRDVAKRNTILKIIKNNYIHRIDDKFASEIKNIMNDTFDAVISGASAEELGKMSITQIQEIEKIRSMKGHLTEQIVAELEKKMGVQPRDLVELKSLTLEDLGDIYNNFYREPTFYAKVPLDHAAEGVLVYPIRKRGGFLIGGNFPSSVVNGKIVEDVTAYRYRDSDGVMKTRLVDICMWLDYPFKHPEYPPDMSVYSRNISNDDELAMLKVLDVIRSLGVVVRTYKNELQNSERLSIHILSAFGILKNIEKVIKDYYTQNVGKKKVFLNGTKEEYQSYRTNRLYRETLVLLFGMDTLNPVVVQEKKEAAKIYNDEERGIPINILENRGEIIYRKLHYSKNLDYPVPKTYNENNFPIYTRKHKPLLKYLLEGGYLSPWYMNTITTSGSGDDIVFHGNLPFIIDESLTTYSVSKYYVEQIFKDPKYGMPIITRIGVFNREYQPTNVVPEIPRKMVANVDHTNHLIRASRVSHANSDNYNNPVIEELMERFKDNYSNYGTDEKSVQARRNRIKFAKFLYIQSLNVQSLNTMDEYNETVQYYQKLDQIKSIENAEVKTYNRTIQFPKQLYLINDEPYRIRYFKDKNIEKQERLYSFDVDEAQGKHTITVEQVVNQAGYSIIDPRTIKSLLKYETSDIWNWDPLSDYKAGAQEDADLWNAEKNRQKKILSDILKAKGSSSSAFIGATNDAVRALQLFRASMPSQVQSLSSGKSVGKTVDDHIADKFNALANYYKKLNTKEEIIAESQRVKLYDERFYNMSVVDIKAALRDQIGQYVRDIINIFRPAGMKEITSVVKLKVVLKNMSMNNVVELIKTTPFYSVYLDEQSKSSLSSFNVDRGMVANSKKVVLTVIENIIKKEAIDLINMYLPVRANKELENTILSVEYVSNFLKYGLISISEESMDLIKNPQKLFVNYNRYKIIFSENNRSRKDHIPLYTGGGSIRGEAGTVFENIDIETIRDILVNMTYTTELVFEKEVRPYIQDITKFAGISKEEKIRLVNTYPIMKVLFKLHQQTKKFTIWNFLTTMYDMWYPKESDTGEFDDYNKQLLDYSFDYKLEITKEDIINYLGDSFCQYKSYKKGINYELDVLGQPTGTIEYLGSGYTYSPINPDDITFQNKTSSIQPYMRNPYVMLIRHMESKDPIIFMDVLVVGEDLHLSGGVSSNLARRCALFYKIPDFDGMNPCFSLNDPNISGKFEKVAIKLADVIKYLEKGGEPYSILELSDQELKFRKLSMVPKQQVVKTYKDMLKAYVTTANKDTKYNYIMKHKDTNSMMMNKYIKEIDSMTGFRKQDLISHIQNMDMTPDFLKSDWPVRKKVIEEEYLERGIDIKKFISGDRRVLKINIGVPKRMLL